MTKAIQENSLKNALTPREVVEELDRFIVGQVEAKKAAAIALRNRYRRKYVAEDLREEIMPKNILMVGPTGVGKTEIARRLSKIAKAPFIKVEATKFTEVGYVGRDVESVIRDLMEISVSMIKEKNRELMKDTIKQAVESKILNSLVGIDASETTRAKFQEMLKEGKLMDKEVEVEVIDAPKASSASSFEIPGMPGGQLGVVNLGDMLNKALGSNKKTTMKKVKVKDAFELLKEEEENKILDEDKLIQEAVELAENQGIVFIDEIDKVASCGGNSKNSEISREGVQRDLLPLIEGTTVATKYGPVRTEHVLFIGSGAFHMSKPSDLLPELQGRLPIRVELKDLTKEDMVRILKEPQASLIKQYKALLATEGVELDFRDDAVEEIAEIATVINREVENIGARRLHTILEKLLEDISFTASDVEKKTIIVDKALVRKNLDDIVKKKDLSNFIL